MIMRLRNAALRLKRFPMALTGAFVALLLIAGFAIIAQSEASYYNQKVQETRVQAEILAASVVAALDFGDETAARESVDALRVNRQVRMVAIYDRDGALVAGYARNLGPVPPRVEATPQVRDDSVIAVVPVMRSGERIGTTYIAASPQPFSTRAARYLLIGLLVVMAALVVAVLGLAQAALAKANRELEDRAVALGVANAELTHQIAERTKAEDQLRQAQKMQALGQLTGGIAHDFNNLLTVIQGSADLLCRSAMTEDRRRRHAQAIVQASARAAALTGQLLAFARRQPLQPEVLDVNALLAGMTDLLDRTLGERFTILTRLDPGICAVEADRAQLASAVLNIAVNARDAMPTGGSLTITTEIDEGEKGQMVALHVADTGSGMDKETLARAMEPFFTTKGTGKGTGLGLSQVYGFASQSGGELRIASAPGNGTTVSILLPCSTRSPAPELVDPASGDARALRTGNVLLVEDNEEVGEFAEGLLRELGHQVTRVRSGEEAIAVVTEQPFDVVFSDVVMPGMSGLELADLIARERPALPVVLTTGYSDEIARSGTGGRPVLLKPYRLESLASILDEALAK